MRLRQYLTPEGTIRREPTQEEIDREVEMKFSSSDMEMLINGLEELIPDAKGKVKDILKKHYKA